MNAAGAQTRELIFKNGANGPYLEHKVAPKETFYGIGKLYNLPPKEIAAFGKLDINKGLMIDQLLQVPLTAANFSQSVNEGAPVYYKTSNKKSLAEISAEAGNVPAESLGQWNNVNGNDVGAGTKLIVGFLLTKEMPVVKIAEAKKNTQINPVPEKKDKEPVKTEKEKPEPEKVTEKIIEKPVEVKPAVVMQPEIRMVEGNGFFKAYFDQQVKQSPATKDATVTAGILKPPVAGRMPSIICLLIKWSPAPLSGLLIPPIIRLSMQKCCMAWRASGKTRVSIYASAMLPLRRLK